MSQQATDHQLGQRFAQLLVTYRPIELATAISLLQDLMGVDVSLLPSIRLLASQPSFLQLVNAKPSAVLLPQRDALLTTAREMLAPALVTRIANFLDGYLSSSSEHSVSTPSSEPAMPFKGASASEPSFPAVLSRASEELPSTVVDQFAAHSNSADKGNPPSAQSGAAKQSRPFALVLIVVAVIAAVVAAFQIPALCEPLGLCPAKENDQETKSEKDKSTKEADKTPNTQSSPSNQAPKNQPAPSAPTTSESTTPKRDEPLW